MYRAAVHMCILRQAHLFATATLRAQLQRHRNGAALRGAARSRCVPRATRSLTPPQPAPLHSRPLERHALRSLPIVFAFPRSLAVRRRALHPAGWSPRHGACPLDMGCTTPTLGGHRLVLARRAGAAPASPLHGHRLLHQLAAGLRVCSHMTHAHDFPVPMMNCPALCADRSAA